MDNRYLYHLTRLSLLLPWNRLKVDGKRSVSSFYKYLQSTSEECCRTILQLCCTVVRFPYTVLDSTTTPRIDRNKKVVENNEELYRKKFYFYHRQPCHNYRHPTTLLNVTVTVAVFVLLCRIFDYVTTLIIDLKPPQISTLSTSTDVILRQSNVTPTSCVSNEKIIHTFTSYFSITFEATIANTSIGTVVVVTCRV